MASISTIIKRNQVIFRHSSITSTFLYQKRNNHTIQPTITKDDPIHRVDLRVGKIVDIRPHSGAEHLFVEQVDLNDDSGDDMSNARTIVSGLAPYMPMDSLLNKYVIVVSNLKPSKFRGVLSQGMLLAASIPSSEAGGNEKVKLVTPPEGCIVGERISLQNNAWEGEPDAVLKPKQKIFEQIVSYLKTNEDGIAVYKGIPLVTSMGPVVCELKNAAIS
ncbi:MAG: hypothetical protein EXX96DRAFT_544654 [Benjaminiella poitrasii]|nr:MAG: hypothetical protein EXX96DRAFT_544654 [Benjaminiella poitrasii]